MLDVRVKERLTGAIILVALLVLLVPELLTGRGHTASSDPAANSEGGQTRSYTIDLADSSASKPVTAAATTPSTETPKPDSQTSVAPSTGVSGSTAALPESDPAASVAPPPSAEPEKPVPAARPGDKPRTARVEPRDEAPTLGSSSRAEAAKPASAAPTVETPKPATARVDTPKATPRAELAKPTPPARTASETASARATSPEVKPASGWAVQVGSFASRENAERLTRELKGKGFAATVSESTSKGKRLWRVRVGPEADRAAAVALGAKLRSAGHSGGSVVSYP